MTLSCGLTTRVLAPLNLPLSFFVNNNMFLGTNHFGTGFGYYHVQKKIQIFIWKAMRNWLPTKKFLTFGHYHWDNHCPRCHTLEMTIHVLWDCPWAKEVWNQSPGILPLSFFWPIIAGVVTVQCNRRQGHPSSSPPLDCLFSFYVLETMASVKWKDFLEWVPLST